jgi:3-hydroxyacyl-CoA dehydrogenase
MTNPLCTLTHEDGVAVLTIDLPPVNALGQAVRQAIHDGMGRRWPIRR